MIRLDNVSLLFWLRYQNSDLISNLNVYESLEREFPVYQEFRENTALSDRLLRLLELDEIVRNMEIRLIDFTGPFSFFARKTYRELKLVLEEFRDQRKKAHDAYEMLRKLSYPDAQGALFEIEFYDRRLIEDELED